MDNGTKRQRILIVDDVVDNIEVLMGLLKDEYKILAATSGEKAITLATRDPQPDLILLDIMMPDMNGYEVCKHLKNQPATQHIPIIFVTAMSGDMNDYRGLQLGATDYIEKPIAPELAKNRIRNCLELGELRQSQYGQLQKKSGKDQKTEQLEVDTAETKTYTSPQNDSGGEEGPHWKNIERPIQSREINRVLVVEDNEINREVVVAQVQQIGCTVETAANGQEALAKITGNQFDLILTDLDMPIMDGYELMKKIQETGHLIPVVAISASYTNLNEEEIMECGFTDYLVKPIDQKELEVLFKKIENSQDDS